MGIFRECPIVTSYILRTHEPCVPTGQVNFPHGSLLPTTYYLPIGWRGLLPWGVGTRQGKKYWQNQKKEFACYLIFLKILTRGIDHTFSHSEHKKFGEQNYKGCKKNYSAHILNCSAHIFSHVPNNFTLFYQKNGQKWRRYPRCGEYLLFSIQIYNIFPRNPNAPQAS